MGAAEIRSQTHKYVYQHPSFCYFGVSFAKNAAELVKLVNFTIIQRDSMGGGAVTTVINLL